MTDAPVIALTATAPHNIQTTICESLALKEPAVVSHTLDRPNIYLSASKSKGFDVSRHSVHKPMHARALTAFFVG